MSIEARRRPNFALMLGGLAALLPASIGRSAEPQDPKLAEQARSILKKYCYRCHGVRFEVPGYNVLDRDILVAKRGEGEVPYVTPGKPDESELWNRTGIEKDMPPAKNPRPTAEERSLLKQWIEAGAAFPGPGTTPRPFLGEAEVLAAIRDHLRGVRVSDRPYQRYFTFNDLSNNSSLGDDELRLARAGLSKVINSLSWKHDLVIPLAIDRSQLIYAVDLRDLGWDQGDLYNEILSFYPYGLKHDKDAGEALRSTAAEVYREAACDMPHLRADWFIANASRPPLYHTILGLPKTAHELERKLEVDAESDFLQNRLARAGFATSGVSSQNRLVDRHPAVHGAYWKSYDFKRNEGTGNLFRFPLGPVFEANPFGRLAFEHAGGELIFNLPNGLQGYLLVSAKGDRIDEGPIEIVGDALKTAGTAAIVNGLSCMACHQNGMIKFKDTIRDGIGVSGEALEKAELLFPAGDAMDQLLAKDEARFLKALDAATGPFLKVGDDKSKAIRDFAEPVGALARLYLKDMGPDDVAAELGIRDPKELLVLLKANSRLRDLGLAPLIRGASIKRSEWDSLTNRFLSTFQKVALEIRLGTPFRVLQR